MRRQTVAIMGFGVGIALVCQTNVWATGVGSYVRYGVGIARPDYMDDSTHLETGFVLDTAVARTRLTNYRLSIGYERREQETDGYGYGNLTADMLVVDNILGFGVLHTRWGRVWIGPEVRLSGGIQTIAGYYLEHKGYAFGCAAGPVLGINVHLRYNWECMLPVVGGV